MGLAPAWTTCSPRRGKGFASAREACLPRRRPVGVPSLRGTSLRILIPVPRRRPDMLRIGRKAQAPIRSRSPLLTRFRAGSPHRRRSRSRQSLRHRVPSRRRRRPGARSPRCLLRCLRRRRGPHPPRQQRRRVGRARACIRIARCRPSRRTGVGHRHRRRARCHHPVRRPAHGRLLCSSGPPVRAPPQARRRCPRAEDCHPLRRAPRCRGSLRPRSTAWCSKANGCRRAMPLLRRNPWLSPDRHRAPNRAKRRRHRDAAARGLADWLLSRWASSSRTSPRPCASVYPSVSRCASARRA